MSGGNDSSRSDRWAKWGRTPGHLFTQDEIAAMSTEEFDDFEWDITIQLRSGKLDARPNPKTVS